MEPVRKTTPLIWLAATCILLLACSLATGANPTPTTSPILEPTPIVEAGSIPEGSSTEGVLSDSLTPAVSPTPFEPYFEPGNCEFVVSVGVEVDCGFVVVSEDRKGNPADTIRLAVAVYRSRTSGESAVPTFYLQGGPGSAALTWAAGYYDDFVNPLLAQGDVIFMDHRGAGLSEPNLNCPEIELVYLDDLQSDWDEESRIQNYIVAFLGCKGRLVLNGANISAYTTTATAADVRDVAAVLGYEQINLYGISYGTRLGQAVMRDYPSLVRSAVFDSVVPLEAKMYNEAAERANYALESLFDGCTADAACATAYPDLEANFYELLAEVDEEPIEIEVDNPDGGDPLTLTVGDTSLLNSMMWALHTPSYVSQTPKLIDDVYWGDYEILRQLKDLPLASLANINIGLRLSVECHDQIFPTTVEALEADINAYPALADYGYSYIFGSLDLLFTACEMWGAAPYDPANHEPLRSDIPTLILAGQYDPTTPAYYGRQLAEHLANSYFFELPGHGHSPSVGGAENCGLAIALNFLADPDSDPTHPCLVGQQQVPFFVPYDGADAVAMELFSSRQYSLQGLSPVDWMAIDNNFYNRSRYWGDPTQIGFQSNMTTIESWLAFLEGNYQYVGLDNSPQFLDVYVSNDRSWYLYTAEAEGKRVDIGLTALPNGICWLVMMTTDPSERDAFYGGLFLPAIDGLAPLEESF